MRKFHGIQLAIGKTERFWPDSDFSALHGIFDGDISMGKWDIVGYPRIMGYFIVR